MMMSLDETIKHCEEVATEHRQRAEWLKELVQLRKFTRFVANHVMSDDFEDNGKFYAEVFVEV